MTAHSGDSFSGDMIFPPFVPRAAQPAGPPPVPAPQPEPVAEAADEPEPWAAPEAEPVVEEPEAAATARAADALPWETPAAEPPEDLPWLELSSPGDEAVAGPQAPVEEHAAEPAPETVPDWLSWDPGAPAAAVTEAPEIPPSGDVDSAAAAREVAESDDELQPMAGLESFDRDETAEVAPVDGLAPVGDFDIPSGEAEPSEPAAAYETPEWAQPSEAWAAPPAEGEDPLLTAAVPGTPADADVGAVGQPVESGASPDEADEPDAVGSALDAEVAALLDAPVLPAMLETEMVAAATAAPQHGDDRLSAMLGEVAGRLESIAHSLRERSPAEVLAGPRDGAADPLELLVTGFVLGYLQRSDER